MRDNQLQKLLEPVVDGLGCELLGVVRLPQRGGVLLRLYIDSEAGVSIADCERVSHQVNGVLAVEEVIRSDYVLEVSSPGLDRPLFAPAHFERFIGSKANVRLFSPLQGRRSFTGIIKEVGVDAVILQEDSGGEFNLAHAQIEKAHLVP